MLSTFATFSFPKSGQETLVQIAHRFLDQSDSGLAGYLKRHAQDPHALTKLLQAYAGLDPNDASTPDHIARLALATGTYNGHPPDWRSLTNRSDAVAADMPSTGGIGNKTPITVFAIVAAVAPENILQPKISSRGASGGTIDILESVGYDPLGDRGTFVENVLQHHSDLINPLPDMASIDAVFWKLRQQHRLKKVAPLTIASILGKKVAVGCECVLIDVKAGPDSKLGSLEQTIMGSKLFVEVGRRLGMKLRCVVTNNFLPQGCCIGRRFSMLEIAQVLRGETPPEGGNQRAFLNLRSLSVQLAARLLDLADNKKKGLSYWEDRCRAAVDGGSESPAWIKLSECMRRRGVTSLESLLSPSSKTSDMRPSLYEVKAATDGQIRTVDPISLDQAFSLMSQQLGQYDNAGIVLCAGAGDKLTQGSVLAQTTELSAEAESLIGRAFRIEPFGLMSHQSNDPAQSPDGTILSAVG